MSLPDLLAGAVGDEDVVARVPLGGDDVLVVTPTRTLVYRAEGLLSDEAVEEYPHGVERLDVSESRRKAKIRLKYGLEGEEEIAVPAKRLDEVLHPLLAGVLSVSNVTEPGESVLRTFRFSELTLVITSHRVVKHIGSAVWDEDFEEFPYEELTGLDFEEGTVATSVVLTHGGRSERFKAPKEAARAVRETLADAVCEYYDVGSLEEFRLTVEEQQEAEEAAAANGTTDFGDGPDPLSASPVSDAEAEQEAAAAGEPEGSGDVTEAAGTESPGEMTVAEAATGESEPADPLAGDPAAEPAAVSSGPDSVDVDEAEAETGTGGAGEGDAFAGSPFESAGVHDDELAAEVAKLRETVEAHSERLDRQSELIETLIEELRRGR